MAYDMGTWYPFMWYFELGMVVISSSSSSAIADLGNFDAGWRGPFVTRRIETSLGLATYGSPSPMGRAGRQIVIQS